MHRIPLKVFLFAVLFCSSISVQAAALETVPFVRSPLPQTQMPNPLPATMTGPEKFVGLDDCNPKLEGLRIPKKVYASSQDPQASRELQKWVERDQKVRRDGSYNEADDLKNRNAVLPLIARASTRQDLYNAALVFQHGNCIAHFQLTYALAMLAKETNLAALSLDRALMLSGKAQKYGTQYSRAFNNCFRLHVVDLRTTDAERAAMKVPTLEKALEQAKTLSGKGCK